MTLSLPPFTRAVKWLILGNAGIFLLTTLMHATSRDLYEQTITYIGLVPYLVTHGYIYQLLTYSFLHESIGHILFNMIGLWMFGSQLEGGWGYGAFLKFYFFCVFGAALTTVAVSYSGVGGVSPITPTIGASGGIFGLIAAFGVIYAENEILLFPLPFSVKAKYFAIGFAFLTLIGAIRATSAPGGAIAYSAHLGGLVFGFLFVKFVPRGFGRFRLSETYYGMRNSYYRWKRRRAARKFEVYMRQHDRKVTFDEHGNYIPPDDDKKNGGSKSGWVN